jgi:hypothetical protein
MILRHSHQKSNVTKNTHDTALFQSWDFLLYADSESTHYLNVFWHISENVMGTVKCQTATCWPFSNNHIPKVIQIWYCPYHLSWCLTEGGLVRKLVWHTLHMLHSVLHSTWTSPLYAQYKQCAHVTMERTLPCSMFFSPVSTCFAILMHSKPTQYHSTECRCQVNWCGQFQHIKCAIFFSVTVVTANFKLLVWHLATSHTWLIRKHLFCQFLISWIIIWASNTAYKCLFKYF